MSEVQKTHFADDDTLAYISKLKAENEKLRKALEEIANLGVSLTTDGGLGRDEHARWKMQRVAAQALKGPYELEVYKNMLADAAD